MDFSNVFGGANGKPPGGGGIGDFDGATPAPEFTPIPPGVYAARVARGEYTTTKAGADAYRLRFEVTDGPQAGKMVVRTWTFGSKALPYTKRDLAPFGLTSSEKLLSTFPDAGREYHVRLVVTVQKGDDGIERNDIKRIDLVRVADGPASGFGLADEDGAA
ncbi:MAG TPA: DUF669 domain-containing protein, partial [Urbifossiella sp.]|nr:DUF669 domain-containing protein [Urbifossiella sp.]